MPGRRVARDVPRLNAAVADAISTGAADQASEECKRLLTILRQRCPGLIPADPLTAGQVGPEIPLDREAGAGVYRLVARQLVGLSTERTDLPGIVVWAKGDDELAVLVDQVSVETAPGALGVAIPVRCDEVRETTVRVRFALGSDDRPAGLVAATDARPFGPPEVIDVWGDELTAFAWEIVLTTAAKLADATGRDVDGLGLIPVALRTNETGIAVLTMARHSFDREASPVTITGSDLGALGDLGKALGLLDTGGSFNSDWMSAPGDRLKHVLADDASARGPRRVRGRSARRVRPRQRPVGARVAAGVRAQCAR